MSKKKSQKENRRPDSLRNSIQRNGYETSTLTARLLCSVYPGLNEYLTKFLSLQSTAEGDVGVGCDLSMLEGAFLVQEKFLELSVLHVRETSMAIPIPGEIQKAMLKWRILYLRYKEGDFRHRESERQAMADVAQWTLDENCKLRNQEPIQADLLNDGG